MVGTLNYWYKEVRYFKLSKAVSDVQKDQANQDIDFVKELGKKVFDKLDIIEKYTTKHDVRGINIHIFFLGGMSIEIFFENCSEKIRLDLEALTSSLLDE